jgi:hypothetical protein
LCNSDGVPGEVGSLKETSLAVWRDAGVVGQKRANVFMPCQIPAVSHRGLGKHTWHFTDKGRAGTS